MTTPIGSNVKASAAAGASATVTTTTTVASNQGAVLYVRSYPGSSGATAQPATPSGWFHEGGVQNTNSSFIVREDVYRQRGSGSTISATVAGTANVARHVVLQRFDGIDRDDFVELVTGVAYNSNRADASVQIPASAYPNACAVAALGIGPSFGGTGAAWNAGSAIEVGGATSSHTIQYVNKGTPSSQTLSATWTNSGVTSILGMNVGGDSTQPLNTPVVALDSKTDPTTVGGADGTATVSWAAIPNAVSYRVEVAPGSNATSGFTIVTENATSPYTVTGLSDGTYTIAVTAKP